MTYEQLCTQMQFSWWTCAACWYNRTTQLISFPITLSGCTSNMKTSWEWKFLRRTFLFQQKTDSLALTVKCTRLLLKSSICNSLNLILCRDEMTSTWEHVPRQRIVRSQTSKLRSAWLFSLVHCFRAHRYHLYSIEGCILHFHSSLFWNNLKSNQHDLQCLKHREYFQPDKFHKRGYKQNQTKPTVMVSTSNLDKRILFLKKNASGLVFN